MTEAIHKPKERVPYNLNTVVPELRDLMRQMSSEADQVIDAFMDDYADGVITEAEFRAHLVRLVKLFKGLKNGEGVLNLLDESGPEAARRQVEYQQQERKGQVKP